MQQIRRSFSSIIARASLATAALAAGGVATAADISWSVGIASPGYQVVVTQAPVVVHRPVVVVQQPRVRVHRPVVMHVAQPQVIYTRAPVFTHGHGHRGMVARDVGRHEYNRGGRHEYNHRNRNKHSPRYYPHDRHGQAPGFDGNWGRN